MNDPWPKPTGIIPWSRSVAFKQCSPVEEFNEPLRDFLRHLKSVMYQYNLAGLSAPQLGIFRCCSVVNLGVEKVESVMMCNLVVEDAYGTEANRMESCAALPGVQTVVRRPGIVCASWNDPLGHKQEGEFHGNDARALQHEYDHLRGVFMHDLIGVVARQLVISKVERAVRRMVPSESRG